MGGPGSGNHYHWWRGQKKETVEGCKRLDASRWMREGILRAGLRHAGTWCWYSDATLTRQTSSLGYEVDAVSDPPAVRLFYTMKPSGEALDYRILLTVTRPRFGGLRWWFVCPLAVNGRPCGRRVGKLYLRGRYFGCRHCHRLTYRSAQEHDKRVDALRRNPAALLALLGGQQALNPSHLLLALKATMR
jgi:hypothetical protein